MLIYIYLYVGKVCQVHIHIRIYIRIYIRMLVLVLVLLGIYIYTSPTSPNYLLPIPTYSTRKPLFLSFPEAVLYRCLPVLFNGCQATR